MYTVMVHSYMCHKHCVMYSTISHEHHAVFTLIGLEWQLKLHICYTQNERKSFITKLQVVICRNDLQQQCIHSSRIHLHVIFIM